MVPPIGPPDRWLSSRFIGDPKARADVVVIYAFDNELAEFRTKAHDHLAIDHAGALVYLAPSRVNLGLTLERWPELRFSETRESHIE